MVMVFIKLPSVTKMKIKLLEQNIRDSAKQCLNSDLTHHQVTKCCLVCRLELTAERWVWPWLRLAATLLQHLNFKKHL